MSKDAFYTDAQGRVRIIPGGGDHRPRPKEKKPQPKPPQRQSMTTEASKSEKGPVIIPEPSDEDIIYNLDGLVLDGGVIVYEGGLPSPDDGGGDNPVLDVLGAVLQLVVEAAIVAVQVLGQQAVKQPLLTLATNPNIPNGDITLHYSPSQQAYQVQVPPSQRGQHWSQVLAAQPQVRPMASDVLQGLERMTQRPITVVPKGATLPERAMPSASPAQPVSQPQVYQPTQTAPPLLGANLPASGTIPQSPQLPLPHRGQRVEQSPSRPWLDRAVFPSARAGGVPQQASLPTKTELNQQMRLIEKVLGDVFDDHDYATPYDQQGSSKVVAKEIKDTTRIVKAALFNTRGDRFTPQELAALQRPNLSNDQQRTLAIARELNKIINQYGKKDDALATAKGIQVIANYNTRDGVLDKDGFKEDLAKYFIDQKWVFDANKPEATLSAVGAKIHKVGESPLAESLFGRDRVGTYRWKDQLQEKGNPEYNQAHHLAAYIIATIDYGDTIAMKEAYLMDKNHPYDIQVSLIATNIVNLIKNNKVAVSMIWKAVYDRIKED